MERRTGVPWPVWSPCALLGLWRAVGKAEIVHIHDALYFGNAFAWLFARLQGIPLIVTQHVGNVPFRSALLRAIHAFANRTLGRLVLSTADQVVFISPSVRQEYRTFLPVSRTTYVLAEWRGYGNLYSGWRCRR